MLYHIMKLQDFLPSSEFCIENESEVYETNIKVRNQIKFEHILSKKLGFGQALILIPTTLRQNITFNIYMPADAVYLKFVISLR